MNRLLGDISTTIDYGVTASAVPSPVGPKFLRITDIQNGAVNWDAVPWCDCSESEAASRQLQDGDIVFARTGATTGKSFLIRQAPSQSVFASYLIRVRLGIEANPVYVSHFFHSPDYWRQIAGHARGVAQPGVNSTSLKTLQIPLPPLVEQKRIAGILDAADALRAKRRAALAQLDPLLQATFLDLFGDPVTNPKGWSKYTVAELCAPGRDSSVGGPFGSDLTQADYVASTGVPVIRGQNLQDNGPFLNEEGFVFVSEAKAKSLARNSASRGDVIVSQRGARLAGQVAMIPSDSQFETYIVSQSQMRLRLNQKKVSPLYLVHYFRSPFAVRQVENRTISTGVPHINLGILRDLVVELPDLAHQLKFVAAASVLERLKSVHRDHLAELDTLYASLQSRAFQGKL